VGVVANFFSIASPALDPNPWWESTLEDVVGSGLKYAAYQGVKSLDTLGWASLGVTDATYDAFLSFLARDAAYAIETVAKDVAMPLVAASTVTQVGVHVYCAFQ
jgi:hypothetical protein